MANLTPVDNDPFADQPPQAPSQGQNLTPVAHDPFDPNTPTYSGAILPFSRYADGSVKFDPNAGIVGAVKSAATLPGDVATGKVQEGSPEWVGRTVGMAGLAASPDMATPGGMAGAEIARGVATPTKDELYASGSQRFRGAFNDGVHFWPDGVASGAADLQGQLKSEHFYDINAPQTHGILDQMQGLDPSQSVPLSQVYAYRERLGEIANGPSTAGTKDGEAARRAIQGIDQFMENPPADAVLSGPAAQAGSMLRDARGDWASASGLNKLQGIEYNAEIQSANPRGSTYDSSLRRKVQPLLNPQYPYRLNGFTDTEKAGIQGIAEGDRLRNSLGTAGEWLGGKGHFATPAAALGAAVLGAHEFGPVGAAAIAVPPMVGGALRGAENALTKKQFNTVADSVAKRSPLYRDRLNATSPTMSAAGPATSAVARGTATGMTTPDQTNNYAPVLGQPLDPNKFYARGGKVKKPTHEFLVNRLMALAEKAKRAEKKATAPILQLPDDVVTTALAKAQEAI